jgi:hypothetical protein
MKEIGQPEAVALDNGYFSEHTMIGKVIYGLRKCTAVCAPLHMMSVEPVIGIIKEVMGFRQITTER